MASFPNEIAILFFAVAAVYFGYGFYKRAEWKNLDFKLLVPSLKGLAILVLPFVLPFLLAAGLHLDVAAGLPYFVAGAALPYLLNAIKMAPELSSVLLLMAGVGITYAIPQEGVFQILSMLAGVLNYKAFNALLSLAPAKKVDTASEPGALAIRFDDVLPTVVWLTAVYWAHGTGPQLGLILGVLSVSLLLRLCQAPLLHEDKVYLKRLVLSITGGLLVLIVNMKLLTGAHFDKLALAAGCTYLAGYLLQSMDSNSEDHSAVKALKQIILIGIVTVAVTRLFGDFGTMVAAATLILPATFTCPQIAALYLVGRCLTQEFVRNFNPNVTGVNLNHPYTSAALYAGFVFIVVAALLIRNLDSRRFLTFIFMLLCALAPAASSFFVHSEPTSSFLVSTTVAGLLVTLAHSCMVEREVQGASVLILASPLMACSAILSNQLIMAGDEATAKVRIIALAVVAAVMAGVLLIQRFVLPPSAPPVSSEPAPAGADS